MTLRRLIPRSTLNVLGVNSGTSADGLDLAVVRLGGAARSPRLLAGSTRRFPSALREMILDVADSPAIPLETVVHLDNVLGRFIGETAARYMKKLQQQHIRVDLIASHGQTVRHVPPNRQLERYLVNGTLQLGSLDRIAARSGCLTTGDFRQADIACGGEGAPITTGAMRVLFADASESRLIVNIGGMANYFYFSARKKALIAARDCGPGNSLSDILSAVLYDEPFDRNGRHAAAGTINRRLLSLLTRRPLLERNQLSTGRELFGPKLAGRMIKFGELHHLPVEDIMATVAELTITGIAEAVRPLFDKDRSLTTLYLMGGGRRNRHFRRRLADCLTGVEIRLIDELGIDGGVVEAAAYAVMGAACVRSEHLPGPITKNTTTRLRPILGHIVQPPLKARG